MTTPDIHGAKTFTPSIFTAMYVERPLPDSMRILSDLGWNTFEIAHEHLMELEKDEAGRDAVIEATRTLMEERRLSAPQAHAFLPANVAVKEPAERRSAIERLERHLELCARLGVKAVVIHPGRNADASRPEPPAEIQRRNVEAFRRLGDQAGEAGLVIGLENLTCPGATTAVEMLDLVSAIDHPAVGLTLDTSHTNMSGLDLPEMIAAFAPRLVATHLSDNDGSADQHRAPGNGTIDWPTAMAAFGACEYRGPLNLEIGGERHPIDAIRRMKVRHAAEWANWLVDLAHRSMHP